MEEDALESGDLGPMGLVPRSSILKGLRLLPQPHQTSQPLSVHPYVSISCGSIFVQSRWHHSPWTNSVRISLSFTVFVSRVFKSEWFLSWGLAALHCCVSAALHPLDSLTERYQYIGFKILTSQIYSWAVNRGCWGQFTEQGVGLVHYILGLWNGICANFKPLFNASPHLSFPVKQPLCVF